MFNVLLVDDSATDRRLFEGLLSKYLQFNVETAEDGSHALKIMAVKVPDVVVTDLQMPNMDGLQLVENIRSLYPLVPVILITSAGSEEVASKALQRGAAGYVPKSRCDELLGDTVENVIEHTFNTFAEYLKARVKAGELVIDDCTLASPQFLMMCQATLFQPYIFQAKPAPSAEQIARVVESAVRVFLAAYGIRRV